MRRNDPHRRETTIETKGGCMGTIRFRVVVVIVASSALLAGAGAQSAMADASGGASCIGIEASSVSPPGSSAEAPGGMAQLVAFVKAEAGGKFGPAASSFARLHAGSHEACDEASE
jgi:hypothetical protein